jgi:hypothetical protein
MVAEDRAANRPGDEPHCVDGEVLQHANQGIRLGKEKLAEDETHYRAVEQKIMPFDACADRASDDSALQLRAMIGARQGVRCDAGCSDVVRIVAREPRLPRNNIP